MFGSAKDGAPDMFRGLRKILIAGAFLLANGLVAHAASTEISLHATYIAVGPETSIPYGWIDFCRRYAGECDHPRAAPVDINLTAKSFAEIDRVNRWVNAAIEPVSDMDHWGVPDQWDYPTDKKGDCEDYALLKRRLLLGLGFPRQALLMTVVKDEHNEGHAILTLKTNHGEFVLDNLSESVKPWNETGYHFVKRQSQSDENVWLQIGDPTPAPALVSR